MALRANTLLELHINKVRATTGGCHPKQIIGPSVTITGVSYVYRTVSLVVTTPVASFKMWLRVDRGRRFNVGYSEQRVGPESSAAYK